MRKLGSIGTYEKTHQRLSELLYHLFSTYINFLIKLTSIILYKNN